MGRGDIGTVAAAFLMPFHLANVCVFHKDIVSMLIIPRCPCARVFVAGRGGKDIQLQSKADNDWAHVGA